MQTITINSIVNVSPPYDIYACNVYGNLCILLATITNPVPPQIIINIPPPYQSAPALGIKMVSYDESCEVLNVLYCEVLSDLKLFQDTFQFYFQDGFIYEFQ